MPKNISNNKSIQYYSLTFLAPAESLTEKNIGPSSANQVPSTAVTHCMYSFISGKKKKYGQTIEHLYELNDQIKETSFNQICNAGKQ